MKLFPGINAARFYFTISGAVLGLCMGIKINSLAVPGLFALALAVQAYRNKRFAWEAGYLLTGWFLVQICFCVGYYFAADDPLAHIHAEMAFNEKYIAAAYPNNWEHVKGLLLYYPRYMFGISGCQKGIFLS